MANLDPQQALLFPMGNIFHYARQYLDQEFKQLGLSRQEWLVLAIVRRMPDGASQRFVKDYLGVETSYLSKVLNKLEDANYIIRDIDRNDRRNRIISLHPKAANIVKKVFKQLDILDQAIEQGIDAKELAAAKATLAKAQENLQEFIKQKRGKL